MKFMLFGVAHMSLYCKISSFLDFSDELGEYGRVNADEVDDMGMISLMFSGLDKLNIIHINIRSLQRNYEELLIYLGEIGLEKVDVLVLSETFLIQDTGRFSLPDFDLFYNQSKYNRNDGVVVFVRKCFKATYNIIEFSEIKVIRCTFGMGGNNFGITGIYRPPSTRLDIFLQDLESLVLSLSMNDNEVILGDLNINILDEDDLHVTQYLNIMSLGGFLQCINKPTRVSINSSTCIDHIFLKIKNYNTKINDLKSAVLRSALTDHYFVVLSVGDVLNKRVMSNKRTTVNKIRYVNLNRDLEKEQWKEILDIGRDVDVAYKLFINKLGQYIERHTFTIEITNKNRKRKPWMTQEILDTIKLRDLLKKKLLKKSQCDSELLLQYRRHRNFTNKIIKSTKNQYYKSKINESRGNYRKIWEVINEATNSQKRTQTVNHKLKIDNRCVTDENEVCSAFNDYFINVGKSIQSKITTNTNIDKVINRNSTTFF